MKEEKQEQKAIMTQSTSAEEFNSLYTLLRLDRQRSPRSRLSTVRQRFDLLKEEVEELRLAIEAEDLDNLEEELGDVLWDWLSLLIVLEESSMLRGDVVIQTAIEKLKIRKPWIFEDEAVTLEEEDRRYRSLKVSTKLEKEKEAKP